MTPQGKAAIIPNGTNVIAVSCKQTVGGQFIDVGIADLSLVSDDLAARTSSTSDRLASH
jgi:hypothetical protein